jgi:mannan endo-1,6-alpha-mannosidase
MKYPDPPDGQPSWLSLAQATFTLQVNRWDTEHCGGGLRWQIFSFNKGYDYKNSISNGGLFQLAARLARYTGNATYAEWADKTWDWMHTTPLFTENYAIYDGIKIENCSHPLPIQWTYNVGVFLMGAANMYNYVGCRAMVPSPGS